MTEKVKTAIGCYFLLPDFKSRGHPNHPHWIHVVPSRQGPWARGRQFMKFRIFTHVKGFCLSGFLSQCKATDDWDTKKLIILGYELTLTNGREYPLLGNLRFHVFFEFGSSADLPHMETYLKLPKVPDFHQGTPHFYLFMGFYIWLLCFDSPASRGKRHNAQQHKSILSIQVNVPAFQVIF